MAAFRFATCSFDYCILLLLCLLLHSAILPCVISGSKSSTRRLRREGAITACKLHGSAGCVFCELIDTAMQSSDDEGNDDEARPANTAPQPTFQPSVRRNIMDAIATYPKVRKSLLQPSFKQLKRCAHARAEAKKESKLAEYAAVARPISEAAMAQFAEDDIDISKTCPVPGIQWSEFDPALHVDKLVAIAERIMARPDVKVAKVGVTGGLKLRFYDCHGQGKNSDMEAYWHNGYTQICALSGQCG